MTENMLLSVNYDLLNCIQMLVVWVEILPLRVEHMCATEKWICSSSEFEGSIKNIKKHAAYIRPK